MTRIRATMAVMLVLCLLLAGCNGLGGESRANTTVQQTPTTEPSPTTVTTSSLTETRTQSSTPTQTQSPTSSPTATRTQTATDTQTNRSAFADPPRDVIGWENGYWYNEPIEINPRDGISIAEREPLLGRAMARVEFIRQHEFTRDIAVRTLTRDQLRRILRDANGTAEKTNRPQEQYYEALFLIGEEADATTVVGRANANSILGFYIPDSDTIWLVTSESGEVAIDESLLIHELTHALQDEYDQTTSMISGIDQMAARRGLFEGEANYVEARFRERCQSGAWECVDTRTNEQLPTNREIHIGVAALGYFPYSDGPAFIHHLYTNGRDGRTGWQAVNHAFVNPPHSSAQIIHPERYPSEQYRPTIEVEPHNGWERDSSGSYGEASIFTMFWYQSYERGVDIVNPETFFTPDGGQYDQLNYTSAPSDGLRGDYAVTVTNGTHGGYVWTTEWDTERDAETFYDAYLKLLSSYGAEQVGEHVWVIPEGAFADAFYVEINGTTVTIVNGPSVDDLTDIYPAIEDDTEQE